MNPSHTARYQAEATIHYPFHPRSGERVEVVRRHRFRGVRMFVVRQPDGTLAQIPIWMCTPAAAVMAVRDRPRLSLDGLRDLRLALDAIPSSLSEIGGGERDGAARQLRQGDLLALMEPGPALPTAVRAAVVPLLAALLLEMVEAETRARADGTATTGGRDEQDRV